MKSLRFCTIMSLLLLFALGAFAQTDQPRDGACFYKDVNYRGDYFCAQPGDALENLPSGFNDRIRSVRIFGNAQVQAFMDNRFGGADVIFRSDVPDLHAIPLAVDPRANWTERISSLRVNFGYERRRWDDKSSASTGACFFEHPGFVGRSFCVDRGQSLDTLPPGFKDGVQSVRVFDGTEVQIFSDTNFSGLSSRTRAEIKELRAWSLPENPSRKWGERIASVRVNALDRRWGGDRDDDDRRGDRGFVRCSSQPGDRQQYCNSRGQFVRDAYMINSYSACKKGVSWGIDDGRLWVSNGCAADFQVAQ